MEVAKRHEEAAKRAKSEAKRQEEVAKRAKSEAQSRQEAAAKRAKEAAKRAKSEAQSKARAVLTREYESLLAEQARLLGIDFPTDYQHLLRQIEQGTLRKRGQGFLLNVPKAPHRVTKMYYQNKGWAPAYINIDADRSHWKTLAKMQGMASTLAANVDIDVFVFGELPPVNIGRLAVCVSLSLSLSFSLACALTLSRCITNLLLHCSLQFLNPNPSSRQPAPAGETSTSSPRRWLPLKDYSLSGCKPMVFRKVPLPFRRKTVGGHLRTSMMV